MMQYISIVFRSEGLKPVRRCLMIRRDKGGEFFIISSLRLLRNHEEELRTTRDIFYIKCRKN